MFGVMNVWLLIANCKPFGGPPTFFRILDFGGKRSSRRGTYVWHVIVVLGNLYVAGQPASIMWRCVQAGKKQLRFWHGGATNLSVRRSGYYSYGFTEQGLRSTVDCRK